MLRSYTSTCETAEEANKIDVTQEVSVYHGRTAMLVAARPYRPTPILTTTALGRPCSRSAIQGWFLVNPVHHSLLFALNATAQKNRRFSILELNGTHSCYLARNALIGQ
jgi:hypothetical protein